MSNIRTVFLIELPPSFISVKRDFIILTNDFIVRSELVFVNLTVFFAMRLIWVVAILHHMYAYYLI